MYSKGLLSDTADHVFHEDAPEEPPALPFFPLGDSEAARVNAFVDAVASETGSPPPAGPAALDPLAPLSDSEFDF